MAADIQTCFVGRAGGCIEELAAGLGGEPALSVEFVTSPDEALSHLDDVDCVVSGYSLPNGDGLELLADVRERDDDLPFILVGTEGSESVASEAITAGVTDYLTVDMDSTEVLVNRIANVVEKYRTERQRRESYLAFETAHEGISLLDDEGRFTYVNERYAETYGYEPEEMVGMHWETLYPNGEERDIYEDVLPQVQEEGFWSGETTGLRKDGSTFPEQHSLALTDDGGLVCVVRDVTQKKERERRLRKREQFLRTFHDITASEAPFSETVDRLLELGRDWFEVDVAFLSRFDQRNDSMNVVATKGDHEQLQPGSTTPLDETYCRMTRSQSEPLVVADAAEEGWHDDPAYERFGLECYMGVPVTVGGSLYGTLCFASTSPMPEAISETEETFLELMSDWLRREIERNQREKRLTSLNVVTESLVDAESAPALCDELVEQVQARFDLPVVGVALYEDGELDVTAKSADRFPASSLCLRDQPGWRAMVQSERVVTDDVDSVDATEVAAVPLGEHGVFLTATWESGGFTQGELGIIETLTSNVVSVLDRVNRERLLQEREQTVREKNQTLERLNSINEFIRDIVQGLVHASSRKEVEELVCEHLGERGPYELAWVGEYRPEEVEIEPRCWGGNERGYLDAVLGDSGVLGPESPAVRAAEQVEIQTVDDVLTDPRFEPWRENALQRDLRSAVAIPIEYEQSVYGIFVVYGTEPDAFSPLELEVLEELGETTAHAINAIESKHGLASERVLNLTFDLSENVDVVELARQADADVSVDSVTADGDDLRAIITFQGATADDVQSCLPRPSISEATLVSERRQGGTVESVFEASLSRRSISAHALNHGGVVEELTVDDGDGRVDVRFPASGDVEAFVETFTRLYPDSTLLSREELEPTESSEKEHRSRIQDRLTPRQQEILEVAYFGGFFRTPRGMTKRELADTLDMPKGRLDAHLRMAQVKLLGYLFDEAT